MTILKTLSDDIRILLLIAAFWMPVMLMSGVYAFRDARRCGRNPFLWAFISAFAPCLMGLIAYLISRDPGSALACPECGTPVTDRDPACPTCGVHFRAVCKNCGSRVEHAWKNCPSCGSVVNADCETISPIPHTSRMLRQILTAVILIPILLMTTIAGIMNFTRGNSLFLTRHETDATLTDDLLDIAYFNTDEWFSITHTNSDGSSVTIEQYFGNYQITSTGSDGIAEEEVWEFAYGGTMKSLWRGYRDLEGDHFQELFVNSHGPLYVAEGSYFYDEAEQLFLYQVRKGSERRTAPHYCASLFYDESGRLIRQQQEDEQESPEHSLLELTPEEANLRYETYTYDSNGNVSRAEQYNHLDELQLYTDYLFSGDGTIRVANTFTPEGELTATSVSQFDRNGELMKQEFYDAGGILTHTVEFGNDVVSFLLLDSSTMILTGLWCLTMLITILMLLPEKKR